MQSAAGCVIEMASAGADVVAGSRECADGTGAQARASFAGLARTWRRREFGNVERFAEPKRSAVAVPKPVAGMDQDANRRWMDRLGAPRPLLERPERRPAEGEKRRRAEVARQPFDDAPAPAVERIVGAVARFRAGGERVRAAAADEAGKDDGANAGEVSEPLLLFQSQRAARNEARPGDGGQHSL